MATDKALVGAAGEHYVAFQMSSRGWAVGMPAQGARLVDLIVANPDSGKSIAVQVKTFRDALIHGGKDAGWRRWHVGKELALASLTPRPAMFLILVDLRRKPTSTSVQEPDVQEPDVFILEWSDIKEPLLEKWPEASADLASARDFWFSFDDGKARRFRNRWDVIEKALAGVPGDGTSKATVRVAEVGSLPATSAKSGTTNAAV